MTMLIAGHETTAAVLTWTVYCLSQHPQHLRRLQQEVPMDYSAPQHLSRPSRNPLLPYATLMTTPCRHTRNSRCNLQFAT